MSKTTKRGSKKTTKTIINDVEKEKENSTKEIIKNDIETKISDKDLNKNSNKDTSSNKDSGSEKNIVPKEKSVMKKITKKKSLTDVFETNEDVECSKKDVLEKEIKHDILEKEIKYDILEKEIKHDIKEQPKTEICQENNSIVNFNHDDIKKIDIGKIKEIDNLTLLKILIVRGKNEYNPALWFGAQRLLRQLNCEEEEQQYYGRNKNNNSRETGRNTNSHPYPHSQYNQQNTRQFNYQQYNETDKQNSHYNGRPKLDVKKPFNNHFNTSYQNDGIQMERQKYGNSDNI